MKNKRNTFLITLALSLLSAVTWANSATLKVTSKDFKAGEALPIAHVFKGFGCNGGNLSPQLSWQGAPKGTKSYVVTFYDPDAPTGSGWWHWTVFNIPASVTHLGMGIDVHAKLPKGAIEGRNDFGNNHFGGACPPKGDKAHRYIFTVFAMPNTLPLDKNASGAMVGFFANAKALAKGQIIAKNQRK